VERKQNLDTVKDSSSARNKVKVTCIENIFDPHNSQKIKEFEPGKSIGELVWNFNPVLPSEMEIVVSVDGVVLESDCDVKTVVPKKGSSVVFSVVPKGGGGGGKNPLAMVAMLAVSIIAPQFAPAWGATFSTLYSTMGVGLPAAYTLANVITAAAPMMLTAVGGLLVNSIFGGASLPDAGGPSMENISSTPTYGWERDPNPQEQGIVVPVLYGRHRVTPPIINSFITNKDNNQIYNALYCVADHPVDFIGNEYINDNPIYNYNEVTVSKRYGGLNQGIIPAFSDVISDKAVGFKLTTDWSQTETSGNAVEGLGVGIVIPGLYYANNRGGLDAQTVTLNIQYRKKDTVEWFSFKEPRDTYTERILNKARWSAGYYYEDKWVELEAGSTDVDEHVEGERYTSEIGISYWRYISYVKIVKGKLTSESQLKVYIKTSAITDALTITGATQEEIRRNFVVYNIPAGQYEVRARLAEELETGTRYRNDTYFSTIQEIIYDDFTYPGTSLFGLEALATDQLQGSAPTVTLEVERTYVDVWTGSEYEQKPANNPAWACYDILHNPIYGAGEPASRFILEDFEEWADYCEEQGYFVNIYMDAASNTRSILDTISLLGNGAVVHKGAKYGIIIDKAEPIAVQHFMYTKGNMIENTYSNSFIDTTERANAIEVTYFDKNLQYSRQIIEIYQDGYDTEQTTINKTSVTLLGCTDRNQAIMFGKQSLLRNRYLTQTISFEAGVDSIACFPGQVIEVSHDVPQWGLSSGRLLGSETNTAVLPEEVTMIPGESYAIQVKKNVDDTVETKEVIPVSVETTTDTLNLVSAWDVQPEKNDLYAFGKLHNITKKFRVLSITRANDTLQRKITAIEYIPEIYSGALEHLDEIILGESSFVNDLQAREAWVFANDGTGKSVIDITWAGKSFSWNVFLKKNTTPWEVVGTSNKPSFRIDRSFVVGETYQISVSPYNSPDLDKTKSITILGKDAPPSNVSNFNTAIKGVQFILTWDHIPDIDLLDYTIVEGIDYNRGNIIASGITENEFRWSPSVSGTYTFWIKARDRTFNESLSATSTTGTLDLGDSLNVIVQREEIPDNVATADLYNLWYDSVNEVVSWVPCLTFDELSSLTFEDEPIVSYLAFDFNNGTYTTDSIDLGVVNPFTLRIRVEKDAILIDPSFDDFIYGRTFRTFPLDTFANVSSLAKYKVWYRYSDDNSVYSDWIEYTNIVNLNTRYIQVKAETDISIKSTNFDFTSIQTILDVDDKIKKVYNQTISSTGTEFLLSSIPITILNSYNVGVTVLGSGVASHTVDIQSDRFTVYIYDAAGNGIERTVNLEISGF